MGDIIEQPVSDVAVTVDVADPDPGDAIAKIELFEDGEVIRTDEPNAEARHWEISFAPASGKRYYFVKITQADGNCLWAAPVWVTVSPQ